MYQYTSTNIDILLGGFQPLAIQPLAMSRIPDLWSQQFSGAFFFSIFFLRGAIGLPHAVRCVCVCVCAGARAYLGLELGEDKRMEQRLHTLLRQYLYFCTSKTSELSILRQA